jgi:hypothetical protein
MFERGFLGSGMLLGQLPVILIINDYFEGVVTIQKGLV